VQSLNDEELRRSGRIHNAEQALSAVNAALDCGFSNVSADIMIGLPGQSQDSLFQTVRDLCSMGLTHISAYCLSIEKNTPFYLSPPSDLPDDESQSNLFEFVVDALKKRCYTHYEISNFSLPGSQCQHNLNYWRGGEYIGLGPSAASHTNGIRRTNSSDLGAYLCNPLTVEAEEDILDLHHKMSEEAILRLRLLDEGLNLDELFDHRVYDADIKERLDALVDSCMLVRTGNKYQLPSARVLTSNQVFMHVLN
jgi:oxygen-independent coproporphyrinogen-3 oxidase